MGTLKVNGDIESNYNSNISIKMTNGSLNTSINTSGGWARGWYITLNGTSVGPLIGGHGSGSNNSMSRIYFGNYDNPWMRIEPTGTVTATKFVGSLQGNADTASKWLTARTLTLTGTVSGSVSFDGSGNIKLIAKNNYSRRYESGMTGYHLIRINSATHWMTAFTVRVYQNYEYFDIVFSGYNYGEYYWHAPQAVLQGSSDYGITVYFGYTSPFNLWVAVPASNYSGIDIIDVVNGYVSFDSWEDLFSIEHVTSLPGTTQSTQTIYRPWYRDETVSNSDKLDGYHAGDFLRTTGGTLTGITTIDFNHNGGGMLHLSSSGNNESSISYNSGGTQYWVVGKGCGGTGNGTFAWWYNPSGKNMMTLNSSGNLHLAGNTISFSGSMTQNTSPTVVATYVNNNSANGLGFAYTSNLSVGYASSAGYVSWGNIGGKPFGYRYFLGTLYHPESGIIVNCAPAASWKMITLHITGNGYGAGMPIDSWFQFYDYTGAGGSIINYSGVNNGCYVGPLRVYIHGGRLWAWFPQPSSYSTISVELICNTENDCSMGHSYFHESGYSYLTTINPTSSVLESYGSSFPAATHVGQVFFLT